MTISKILREKKWNQVEIHLDWNGTMRDIYGHPPVKIQTHKKIKTEEDFHKEVEKYSRILRWLRASWDYF